MVLLRAPTEGNGSRRVKSMQNGEIDMPGNERLWTTAEVLRRTGRSPEPGELFWFLYDEWDEVLERQASGRLSLDSMLFATRAMDLRGANGEPVRSKATLRRTLTLVAETKQRQTEKREAARLLLRTPAFGNA